MTLQALWLRGLRAWADRNFSIVELWQLGNPADVTNAGDDQIEMVAILSPPDESTDWAFFDFINKQDLWAREISAIVGQYVNLEALKPGPKSQEFIGATGVLLWSRRRGCSHGCAAAGKPNGMPRPMLRR